MSSFLVKSLSPFLYAIETKLERIFIFVKYFMIFKEGGTRCLCIAVDAVEK
jgi:hypothetical protein